MEKTYRYYNISEAAIKQAEKVLEDNGVERDEVQTVLQALGYVLIDCEFYPAPMDITAWTNILSKKEVDECQEFTARIHWGFNRKSLMKQIRRFEKGTDKTKCKVFFILEDCNYHTVAGLLAEGKVKEAYEWAKQNLD